MRALPEREEWECFLSTAQSVWRAWQLAFAQHPAALLMLYDGVAFYRYVSGAYWEGFAAALGVAWPSPNEQRAINQLYQVAAARFSIDVASGNYVNSAVRQIGVPISMWESVLQVCEWALWNDGWRDLDTERWHSAMTRRLGGRTLLTKFLVENRESASQFIQEMLDARELLRHDPAFTLTDIAHVCALRREYFEEVPETADFLRENDPESLFADRARLSWNEERDSICLHLPPVAAEKLPAEWQLGERGQPATNTAGEMVIDGDAFAPHLRLGLRTGDQTASQQVAGISEWALWDEGRRRFVPPRDHLPLAQYALLSRQPLAPQLDGWASDPDDPAVDLARELTDGSPYFLTRLQPATRRPRLKIGGGPWLTFAERRDVIVRLFCGCRPATAARFGLMRSGVVRVEEWPRPFLEVPLSLMPESAIENEFQVFLNGKPARGRWKTYEWVPGGADETNAERARCLWKWDDQPLADPVPPMITLPSFRALDGDGVSPLPLKIEGVHTLHVESQRLGRLSFGLRPEVNLEMLPPTPAAIWPSSWGDYIAWILLSQVQDDATWDEVCFASEAVAMWKKVNLESVYRSIRKLERHGFLAIRGSRYLNFRSRIAFGPLRAQCFTTHFCGLCTALYELVRAVPPIAMSVRAETGRPPALELQWPQHVREEVHAVCEPLGISIANKLW